MNIKIKKSKTKNVKMVFLVLIPFLIFDCCLALLPKGACSFKLGTSNSYPDIDSKKAFALKFTEEIVGIDIDAYDSFEYLVSSMPYVVGSVPYNYTDVTCRLCRGRLVTEASFAFIDHKFDVFNLYSNYFYCEYNAPPSPPLLKNKSASNALTIANDVLSKYKLLVNASYIDRFTQHLTMLSPLNTSQRITSNDVVLSCSRDLQLQCTNLKCEYLVDGITGLNLGISMSISDGGWLTSLADSVSIYKIGSTTVSIREADAVQMALNEARSYIDFLGAKISKIETKLSFMHSRYGDGLLLYPQWAIIFTFDKFYRDSDDGPPDVNGYAVCIWADTGEIYVSQPQCWYVPANENVPLTPLLFLPPLGIVLMATTTTLILWKNRKKQRK